MRDLLFHDLLLEVRGRELAAAGGHHCPALDRVAARLPQRQHLVPDRQIGEVEAGHPPDSLQGVVQRGTQLAGKRNQITARGHRVEPADLHVDRMYGPAADGLHDRVAGPPERQTTLDEITVVTRQLDSSRIAEEIRRVQQVDVQRVAGDPLAAVQQPAQVGDRPVDGHPARGLDGQERARLVRDRADAADPGRDVRRLPVRAPAKERLEEPRRLVDVEANLVHLVAADADMQGALALYPGYPCRCQRPLMTM